jgi:hypothetical protein
LIAERGGSRGKRFLDASAGNVDHCPGDVCHAGRPVSWVGLQHRLDHRPKIIVDVGQVGDASTLFHDLKL